MAPVARTRPAPAPAAARDMTFDRCRRGLECLECSDATIASPMPHG